jgi:large repetitive protein
LWRSDGTAEGTFLVKDINPGPAGAFPSDFAVMNGLLYFDALEPLTGFELWRTDGTESGTVLVYDANPGPPYGRSFIVGPRTLFEGRRVVLFSATDGLAGLELWKNDDRHGSFSLGDIAPGHGSSHPQVFTGVGNLVMFTANDNTHGRELWVVPSLVENLPEPAVAHMPIGLSSARFRHDVPLFVDERLETFADERTADPDYPDLEGTPGDH